MCGLGLSALSYILIPVCNHGAIRPLPANKRRRLTPGFPVAVPSGSNSGAKLLQRPVDLGLPSEAKRLRGEGAANQGGGVGIPGYLGSCPGLSPPAYVGPGSGAWVAFLGTGALLGD